MDLTYDFDRDGIPGYSATYDIFDQDDSGESSICRVIVKDYISNNPLDPRRRKDDPKPEFEKNKDAEDMALLIIQSMALSSSETSK